jgi:hypothetical protein
MEDALRLGGAEAWIDKTVIAVVRWMASAGSSKAQLSPDQIERYAMTFETQLRFVTQIIATHKRNLTTGGMGCCYVLALLAGESEQSIARFSEVMCTGEIEGPHENAAIRLREYLLMNQFAWNGTAKMGTAKRAQRAIHAFCKKTPLAKLFEPDEWIYPFPALSAVIPDFTQSRRWSGAKLTRRLTNTTETA